jgi:glycosyltransferase involved in cell wall biosynthesis
LFETLKQTIRIPARHVGIFRTRATRRMVGTVGYGYGYERVTYGLPIARHTFKRLIRLPIHRVLSGSFYEQTPIILDRSVGVIHTWNSVPVCDSPFLVSFENELPRYFGKIRPWQIQFGLDRIASPRCRALLALSDTACQLTKARFAQMGLEHVARKVRVFRGGVVASTTPGPTRGEDPHLCALFVGGSGFAKGLAPVVEAIEELRRGGLDIRLTIVSHLADSRPQMNYVLRGFSPDMNAWAKKISGLPWIQYRPRLPNSEVLRLMHSHDVLVFPSLDETLGWVVVEAGLAGMPSITSNVYALPELVSDARTGYVVKLAIGADRRWKGIWAADSELEGYIEEAYAAIRKGVTEALSGLFHDRSKLEELGRTAREQMKSWYDMDAAGQALDLIYDDAAEI